MTTDETQANLNSVTSITIVIGILVRVFSNSIFGSSRSFVSSAIAWYIDREIFLFYHEWVFTSRFS